MNWNPGVKQGWQCPICGKVHAPWVPGCDCHKRTSVATTGTNTSKSETVSVHIPYSREEWINRETKEAIEAWNRRADA